MSSLAEKHLSHKEELEWVKAYSSIPLNNQQRIDMLENYLNKFNVPEHNQVELVASGHTMIPELPLFSLLEKYCKAIGLQVEYIKVGSKEQLFLRLPKGFLK